MTTQYEPVACSLPAGDAVDHSRTFSDLMGMVVSSEPLVDGIALTFHSGLADKVDEFVAREAECCSFLTLVTSRSDEGVRLEVSSENPDAHRMIDTMFGAGRH